MNNVSNNSLKLTMCFWEVVYRAAKSKAKQHTGRKTYHMTTAIRTKADSDFSL